ncbi:MAG: DUF2093 domain-containing protein [Alphaproteobacteria bacterium]
MNHMERPRREGEARIRYQDGDFQVLAPGAFVICAVTGAEISLQALKYWSVARQEAYADAAAAAKRYGEVGVI